MSTLVQLQTSLAHSYSRSIIWVEGACDQFDQPLSDIFSAFAPDAKRVLLLSDRKRLGIAPISRGEFVRHLGESYPLIVLDAYAGLNPATLAQAIGTIQGGGCLVLLTPPAEHWVNYFDPEYLHLGITQQERPPGHYISWLINALVDSPAVYRYSAPAVQQERPLHQAPTQTGVYRGVEQQIGVYALLASWRKPTSCTVLDGDRGRGKSSLLGLALALQSSFSTEQIALCVPDRRAAAALLMHYQALRGGSTLPSCYLPAELLQQMQGEPQALKCILVDEAAGVSVELLQRFSEAVPHIVLSSTLHGYEGLARGYGLKFLKRLEVERTDYQRLQLTEPLRWSQSDALERWVARYLLLDSVPESLQLPNGFSEVSQAQLLEQEQMLVAVYQLLAQAHYRTSPADLRLLLDSPRQRLFTLTEADVLVGVLWVAEEGPLAADLSDEVMQGRRRPKGNLLPQCLLHYCGWRVAGQQRFWRVVRIAVTESKRRQGLARSMLEQLEARAAEQGVDFSGASFAGQPELEQFWQESGYQLVRQGESVDPVAAAPAMQVLKPLSPSAERWLEHYTEQTQTRASEARLKRDQLALYNFAHHFAPLTLVREQLIELNLPSEMLHLIRAQNVSPKATKPVREWLRHKLADKS